MKRLMIYSKHQMPKINDVFGVLKENSKIILLFSLLTCGMITGSGIAHSLCSFETAESIKMLFLFSAGKWFLVIAVFSLILFIINICSAFSCFGAVYIAFLPVIMGILCGIYLSSAFYLINDNTTYIKTVASFIPGVAINACAFIISASKSMQFSKKTAAGIFGSSKENFDIKGYVIVQIILFTISIIGAGIVFLINKILM